jgi:hypothetical protein
MSALALYVEGIGAWADGVPDWPALRALLCGEGTRDEAASIQPMPALLPAAERRRAPASVRMAIEVASQAVAMSGRDAAVLPSVFASAYGDLGIMDDMCMTLASRPQELSPTRFHNSVHNAAAGYWTIATGCHAGSSAVAAAEHVFAAGLLEAAMQVRADATPLLLVASDAPGVGPLAEMVTATRPFGCALVLAPEAGPAARARLTLELVPDAAGDGARHSAAIELARANLSARGWPLLEALAHGGTRDVALAVAPALTLGVHVENMD